MKLYTEEQVIKMLKEKTFLRQDTINAMCDSLTPIELPTDEEIKNKFEPKSTMYELGFGDGAQWMKEQIQGGNK